MLVAQQAPLMAPPTLTKECSIDDIRAVLEEHYSANEVAIVLGLLQKVTRRREEGCRPVVEMDMAGHDLLDAVMADEAIAGPGTMHERLNQTLLPQGYAFLHDRHRHCVLEIVET